MKQSLDEFMQWQEVRLRATIEPTKDADKVKVTPWMGSNCGCDASLIVSRSAIGSVAPTGQQHLCCGKLLQIVDVEWSDEGRELQSVFAQLLGRGPDTGGGRLLGSVEDARTRRGQAPDVEDCQSACGDEYQACLEGCDPRDGGCIYSCKLRLHQCLRRCQGSPPEAPRDDIPTESCNATIDITVVGKDISVSENISNTLRLSGPASVRKATIEPFTIKRDATTKFVPGVGRYVRATGAIEIPGTVEVTYGALVASANVRLTTGYVRSPSGKYEVTGAPLDSSTRELTLVGAGAISLAEYLVSVVVTLSRLPA